MAKQQTKPTTPQPGDENRPVYTVAADFRDKDNFEKVYEKGQDVSHLDKDRLDKLVSRGLVDVETEEQEEQDPPQD